MLDSGQLILGVVPGADWTPNPPYAISSEQVELGFVAPDVFSPLPVTPMQVGLGPGHTRPPVLGNERLLDGHASMESVLLQTTTYAPP